jgi:hypothetical protein
MLMLHLHFETNSQIKFLIDESTVQSTKNAYNIWNKPFANETRLGLIEKLAHRILTMLTISIKR